MRDSWYEFNFGKTYFETTFILTTLEIKNDVCHRYRTVVCTGLGRILSNARFVDKNNNLAQKVSERQFDSLISSEKSFVGKKTLGGRNSFSCNADGGHLPQKLRRVLNCDLLLKWLTHVGQSHAHERLTSSINLLQKQCSSKDGFFTNFTWDGRLIVLFFTSKNNHLWVKNFRDQY